MSAGITGKKPLVTGAKASSIDQFCADHSISRPMFYKLLNAGKAPRLMQVGAKTLISDEASAEWRRRMEADAETAAA